MGAGIVKSQQLIREDDQDLILKYQHMLPKYFTINLTEYDLITCRKHWETITMDIISGFQQNEGVRVYYDSCKMWLHSLLYHELMITSSLLSSKHPEVRHNFINLMRAMVVIALKQEKDHHESHDNEIKLLCSKIQNLGFDYDTFIAFGTAFLTSLQIISGREWSSQLDQSWKSLFSSIIIVCLPSFPIKESHHLSTCEDHSAMLSTTSRLTVGLQNDKLPAFDHRMYTSQYNSVIF